MVSGKQLVTLGDFTCACGNFFSPSWWKGSVVSQSERADSYAHIPLCPRCMQLLLELDSLHGCTMAAELLAIYDVGCYNFFCLGFSSPDFFPR